MFVNLITISKIALLVATAAGSFSAPTNYSKVAVDVQVVSQDNAQVDVVTDSATEILWLARALYSETKNIEEMKTIGCVVKNRVAVDYRGTNYESVVRAPGQFSGLEPGDPQYYRNTHMTYKDNLSVWRSALRVASEIYSGQYVCEIPSSILHFYSPASVSHTPSWADGETPVLVLRDTETDDPNFVLFSNIK